MEVLHLRYFVAVAEELNFSRAARKLHMAASPLSQRIKDLEHELGQPLFERSTHKVSLTRSGAALLPMAREVLENINSIPWRLKEATGPQRRTIFLGMPAGVHPDLRDRVRELEERCGAKFDLKRWPGGSGGLISAVHDGRLALTIARLPVSDPALEMIEVMSETLGAAVPADRFRGRSSVSLPDLADLSYVSFPADHTPAYFEQLDAQLLTAGIKKRVRLPGADYAGATELISSGIAFSVTMLGPKSPMRLYRLDNVTILPFDDFDPELRTGLLWRKDRAAKNGDLKELVRQAKEIFTPILSS